MTFLKCWPLFPPLAKITPTQGRCRKGRKGRYRGFQGKKFSLPLPYFNYGKKVLDPLLSRKTPLIPFLINSITYLGSIEEIGQHFII